MKIQVSRSSSRVAEAGTITELISALKSISVQLPAKSFKPKVQLDDEGDGTWSGAVYIDLNSGDLENLLEAALLKEVRRACTSVGIRPTRLEADYGDMGQAARINFEIGME